MSLLGLAALSADQSAGRPCVRLLAQHAPFDGRRAGAAAGGSAHSGRALSGAPRHRALLERAAPATQSGRQVGRARRQDARAVSGRCSVAPGSVSPGERWCRMNAGPGASYPRMAHIPSPYAYPAPNRHPGALNRTARPGLPLPHVPCPMSVLRVHGRLRPALGRTWRAMSGSMEFREALRLRLELLRPSHADVRRFTGQLPLNASPGIR